MKFLIFITGGLVAWWVLYNFMYSPKARIKRLWKEIFEYSAKIGESRREHPSSTSTLEQIYNPAILRRGKMINAILDYHFDPIEDKEYVTEHKYSSKEEI